jgi:hypothetical protein
MLLTGSALRDLAWRKARRSVNNGACVEVASAGAMLAVRDSMDPDGPVLMYSRDEWHAFLDSAKKGTLDDVC